MLTTLLLALAAPQEAPQFTTPMRLMAGRTPVKVEAPGYAAPCWHDVDGDGRGDLVVGQFRDGKMQVFRNLGPTAASPVAFAAGSWLQAEGDVAEVPGVW